MNEAGASVARKSLPGRKQRILVRLDSRRFGPRTKSQRVKEGDRIYFPLLKNRYLPKAADAMVGAHTRALTALRPIRPTSRSCRSARQPKPGRRSTYRRGNSVQTIGATSLDCVS